MIKKTHSQIEKMNEDIDRIYRLGKMLDKKTRELKDQKKRKIEETKKLVDWALVTDNENVKDLREQWLMAATLIYDKNEAKQELESKEFNISDTLGPTQVLSQDDIDGLLGFDDEVVDDDEEDGDLAAEWEIMMGGDIDENDDYLNPNISDSLEMTVESIRRTLQRNH